MKQHFPRLQLESLEGRDCPSVTVQTVDNGHTLRIIGDDLAQSVSITQDDVNDRLLVDVTNDLSVPGLGIANLQQHQFQSSMIKRIVVSLRGGDDSLNYSLMFETDYQRPKSFLFDTGAGNDWVHFDMGSMVVYFAERDGGPGIQPGDPMIPHVTSIVKLAIETGAGDDNVSVNLGHLDAKAHVRMSTSLGDGEDSFYLNTQGDVAAQARLAVSVHGGIGDDLLNANLLSDIQEKAVVDIAFHGGWGNDVLNAEHYGTLIGRLNLRAWGSFGHDEINFGCYGQLMSTGKLSVRAAGEAGRDTFTLNAWSSVGPSFEIINSLFNGGSGKDTARLTTTIPMISVETVEWLPAPV